MTLELSFALAVLFLVLALVCPKVSYVEELSVEAQEAVRHLLSAGACIELKGWHLYRTKNGKYAIMQFDANSDIVPDTDKTFVDMESAVTAFVEKTK